MSGKRAAELDVNMSYTKQEQTTRSATGNLSKENVVITSQNQEIQSRIGLELKGKHTGQTRKAHSLYRHTDIGKKEQ